MQINARYLIHGEGRHVDDDWEEEKLNLEENNFVSVIFWFERFKNNIYKKIKNCVSPLKKFNFLGKYFKTAISIFNGFEKFK